MKKVLLPFFLTLCAAAQDYVTGQGARLIIGQWTFTDQNPYSDQKILGSVSGVAYHNDTLYIVDSNRLGGSPNNQRILVYPNVSSFIYEPHVELPQGVRCPACVGEASVVLGQKDFTLPPPENAIRKPSQDTVRNPLGIAAGPHFVAVADTDNNRVLLWRAIPASNGQPAEFVIGQSGFDTNAPAVPPTASSLRGPQGVWFDANGGLWVADTGNNRVLFYGIPNRSGQEATLVLGQKDFVSNPAGVSSFTLEPTAENFLSPVSVTTDGLRLFVTDLAFNRVLIWNTIPTSSGVAPDVVVGHRTFLTGGSNQSNLLCEPNGTDENDDPTYPPMCGRTLSVPRFALSDGRRLYISDSGNDRVLVYNEIPRFNGANADVVLGQFTDVLSQASDSAEPLRVSSSDSFRTPMGLAHDGTNLYIVDIYNRRVVVYTPGDYPLPVTAVRNAASLEVYAVGGVTVGGVTKTNDELTIKIGEKEYEYKVVEDDTFLTIAAKFVELINADGGDQNVLAIQNANTIVLTARQGGLLGNEVTLTTEVSTDATTTLTTSGATLAGGQDAARIAPYTLVSILGENLSDTTASVEPTSVLPTELGGVQVYFDGARAAIQSVSPTQITAQMPVDVVNSTSTNAIVRTTRADGRVTVSSAVGVPIIGQNPGVFAEAGTDPRPAVALHSSSRATGVVSVDGSAAAGDVATISIEDREYSYTVKENDTLNEIMNGLIEAINAGDSRVEAFRSGPFTRVRLQARIEGPDGNGIRFSAKANDGAQVLMTATNSALCCANQAGALVTPDNPALPGETIVILATGLGEVDPPEARALMLNGQPYNGPYYNIPKEFVASLAGGRTANVLYAGLRIGAVGVYEVHLELNTDLPTNMQTQATIFQQFQVSNIFTFPVVNPNQPVPE